MRRIEPWAMVMITAMLAAAAPRAGSLPADNARDRALSTIDAAGLVSDVKELASDAEFGRTLTPDPTPEYGAFFRSDHYPFAKKGVPAIFGIGGPLDDPAPDSTMSARFNDYLANKYYRPSDEYAADWDMRGITDDVKIYFLTGYAIADDSRAPNWYFGSEFRPLCDRLRARKPH
jgi:Zn-dependent M28 family amino/carboxypeptidase